MNAPAKLAMFAPAQPMITDCELLVRRYKHGDLLLDVYGTRDDDEIEVVTVSLTGMTVDLWELVSPEQIAEIQKWCELNLPSDAEMRRQAANEAAIEAYEWQKGFDDS